MKASRRDILAATAAAGSLAALGGCEKLVSKATERLGQTVPDSVKVPDGVEIDPAHHLLNRAGFGPWPGDVEQVRAMGETQWIDQQLDPKSIRDDLCEMRAGRCQTYDEPAGECFEFSKETLRRDVARYSLLRAIYSKRQLFEAMVGFWTDHLNVNIEKGKCIYLKPADDREVVRKHALGKFRDLIRASATSPAMLIYLDGNENAWAKEGDVPNENYGRELLELHTLGVHGGYSQQDVKEAARALTGWRMRTGFRKGSVYFDEKRHDGREKKVLGHVIPAGGKEKDIDDLVDIACRHPSTATHIATKLVRRFVSEDAPDSLVTKTAEVFRASDGDIKQTVRTVLTSDEFKASHGMKFKPPFRFVVSALRAVGADTHAHDALIEYLTRMGQGVFQYPTPDGYPDKTSPWLGTLLWRWNFAFALSAGGVPSVEAPLPKLLAAVGATGDSPEVKLFEHFTGHAPTDEQRKALAEATEGKPKGAEAAKELIGLIIASPSFQRY
ncbi:MAG: hypothetical protein JWN24_4424 [Phycisphaerales bacterium]|nr:hypothetical protein [Phycisphaerales bacterium]